MKAGLQERDVILKCQGRDMGRVDDLLNLVGNTVKGTKLPLEVWRLQRIVSVEVTIE